MNTLYIFAIGGTGERVLKSFVMALGAGMEVNANAIQPIFIDTDIKSKALEEVRKLITEYSGVQKLLKNNKSTFFKTLIRVPISFVARGEELDNLQKMIGAGTDSFPKDAKTEFDLLFDAQDQAMRLTIGFVGNPNIGAVVLNKEVCQSKDFSTLMTEISSDDGVFIIGSVFGGTGAAGIPLIVNKLNNSSVIETKPSIAASAVLPYFRFNDEKDESGIKGMNEYDVQSKTFRAKSKAALLYYSQYMKNLHYMYYIGDDNMPAMYTHAKGGPKQKNPAHIVELLTALCIADFTYKQPTIEEKMDSKPEYLIPLWGNDDKLENSTHFDLSDIPNAPSNLKKALIKFHLFKIIWENEIFLKQYINDKANFVVNTDFNTDYLSSSCTSCLRNFFVEYDNWLQQLGNNSRCFSIFDNEVKYDETNVTAMFKNGNEEFGIAKRNSRMFRKETPEDPKIKDALIAAGKSNKPKGEKESHAWMISIISEGLETVLEKKCNL